MTKTVKCPDCTKNFSHDPEENIIIPDDAIVGDIFECPVCGAEMELVSSDPVQVAIIEEEK